MLSTTEYSITHWSYIQLKLKWDWGRRPITSVISCLSMARLQNSKGCCAQSRLKDLFGISTFFLNNATTAVISLAEKSQETGGHMHSIPIGTTGSWKHVQLILVLRDKKRTWTLLSLTLENSKDAIFRLALLTSLRRFWAGASSCSYFFVSTTHSCTTPTPVTPFRPSTVDWRNVSSKLV